MREYHDATFVTASLDWSSGTVAMTFRLSTQNPETIRLIIRDAVEFTYERRLAWGNSVSVNRLEIGSTHADLRRVDIEMQSGDRIVAIGKEVFEQPAA